MYKRLPLICASLLVVALVAGCGGGGGETNAPPPPAGGGGPAGGNAFDMSKATATVSGKISFEGTPPPNDKIQIGFAAEGQRIQHWVAHRILPSSHYGGLSAFPIFTIYLAVRIFRCSRAISLRMSMIVCCTER